MFHWMRWYKILNNQIKILLISLYFQNPFNHVTYDFIGDDSAPSYFSLDTDNGDIKVREEVDLPADTEITYMVGSL
jgi:hypothetical protein